MIRRRNKLPTSLNPDDPIVRSAVFGKQVEQFLDTAIGRYLVGRAEEEAERALSQLRTVAPWRRRRIMDLQNQVYRAEAFQQWLADAIIDGQQALTIIEDSNAA